METLKAFAYFRIHPFLSIIIITIVGIIGAAMLLYSAPTAYGIPFGGLVSVYIPSCFPFTSPPVGVNTCAMCPICGFLGPACATVGEMTVSGITYCPTIGYPFLGGGIPKVGGYVLGIGTPITTINSIMPPTGVSL